MLRFSMRLAVLLSLFVHASSDAAWSFKDFLEGEWDMERQVGGQIDHAHYKLKAVDNALEGTYHEDGEFGPTNEMIVRVVFDDAAGLVGSFQLAKLKAAQTWEEGASDEPPVPQPQPEPKAAFDFAFRPQSDGRFHLSESHWLGKAGGTVQFLALDDAFVFTKVVCASSSGGSASAQTTSWTATRHGAPRKPTGAPKDAGTKRSMLQRWGWYLFAALGWTGYKAVKEQMDKKTK